MLLLLGSVYNEFCQASSEQRGATEPNLSRGKAHLSSWDDKPGAIQKQIAQLPHCEALWGSRLRAGNRDATDSWRSAGKRRWRREISNTLIYADGAYGQPLLCSCTQNFNETINSKERKKIWKESSFLLFVVGFFCFQALGWAVLISRPHFS